MRDPSTGYRRIIMRLVFNSIPSPVEREKGQKTFVADFCNSICPLSAVITRGDKHVRKGEWRKRSSRWNAEAEKDLADTFHKQ